MKNRQKGQKEQETELIMKYWFKYVNSNSGMPSVDDFAVNFLQIPKNKLNKIRKGEKLEDDITIIDKNTIHPTTFKELFKDDIDKWLKNEQKQLLKTFKGNKHIIVELFHCILPETVSYNGFYSLQGYYYPSLDVPIKAGVFYPCTTASFGITVNCIDKMEGLN